MVEFLIVLPLVLLLVFGTLQFSLIYHAKITLNYAAFEAARAGSLANADLAAIQNGFERGMLPVHTYVQDIANSSMSDRRNAVFCSKKQLCDDVQNGYAQIRIINPSAISYGDHGFADASGNTVIPNDNLMYRDAAATGASQQSVQDANLLKVHIGYCYELIVPIANRALSTIMGGVQPPAQPGPFDVAPASPVWTPPPNSFAANCINDTARQNPSIPIFAQGLIRMQSEAIEPNPANAVNGFYCVGFNCPLPVVSPIPPAGCP